MKAFIKNGTPLKGFTIIELLVSLAIMMGMTGILFIRYPEAIRRMTLTNLTHSVSLLVREAQVRGSAVDSSSGTIGGYGVYISLANPDKIILFGDTVSVMSSYQIMVGDGFYQTTPVDETNKITTLPTGYKVSKLCVWNATAFDCSLVGASGNLTVSFTRPNPQPSIYLNNAGPSYSSACIELSSPDPSAVGHVRSVQVFNSGMIRTLTTGCI